MRRFIKDYVRVLYSHNDGPEAVCAFVRAAHGEGSACPHPRVLPNLVAVCLAAVFCIYEHRRLRLTRQQQQWINIQVSLFFFADIQTTFLFIFLYVCYLPPYSKG